MKMTLRSTLSDGQDGEIDGSDCFIGGASACFGKSGIRE